MEPSVLGDFITIELNTAVFVYLVNQENTPAPILNQPRTNETCHEKRDLSFVQFVIFQTRMCNHGTEQDLCLCCCCFVVVALRGRGRGCLLKLLLSPCKFYLRAFAARIVDNVPFSHELASNILLPIYMSHSTTKSTK